MEVWFRWIGCYIQHLRKIKARTYDYYSSKAFLWAFRFLTEDPTLDNSRRRKSLSLADAMTDLSSECFELWSMDCFSWLMKIDVACYILALRCTAHSLWLGYSWSTPGWWALPAGTSALWWKPSSQFAKVPAGAPCASLLGNYLACPPLLPSVTEFPAWGSMGSSDLSNLIKSAYSFMQIIINLSKSWVTSWQGTAGARQERAALWGIVPPALWASGFILPWHIRAVAWWVSCLLPHAVEPRRRERAPAIMEPLKGYDGRCYLYKRGLDIAF